MEWFFNAREGLYGPFRSEEEAESELKKFIKFNMKTSDNGGRGLIGAAKLSITPINDAMNPIKLRDTKNKKGEEP